MVEFLVALMIAMGIIAIIVETQQQMSQTKNATQGVQAAQSSAINAIHALDLATKKSGFGMNIPSLYGANINFNDPFAGGLSSRIFSPVEIVNDGINQRVGMMWGTSNTVVTPIKLTSDKSATLNTVNLDGTFGVQTGDLVAYAENGKPLSIHQATSIDTPNASIAHAQSSAYPWNADLSSVYPSGGYTTNANLINLGRWERQNFRIQNNQMWVTLSSSQSQNDVLLADNILRFRAQYGVDNGASGGVAGDGVVDAWINPPFAGVWSQIVAIKFVVLSRNPRLEKNTVTTSLPTWSGGVFDISAAPMWGNYRYRVFESVSPVRNSVWFVGS
jgi:type IV pilus assembly protein PilW